MSPKHTEHLKSLFHSPTWEALLALRDDVYLSSASNRPSLNSEWAYMQESLRAEGKRDGISQFLKEIEKLVTNDK